MRYGTRSLAAETAPSHPLEHRLQNVRVPSFWSQQWLIRHFTVGSDAGELGINTTKSYVWDSCSD